MFKVHALPARYGDSLLITYGEPTSPHYVLIDGGTGGTRHDLQRALDGQTFIELLVVSHIDCDHIEGVLKWLEDDMRDFEIGDVWFNGWSHLPHEAAGVEGALQGERLSRQISAHNLPWNNQFSSNAAALSNADAPLPHYTLAGGLQITLLSPTHAALAELRPVWEREVREAGLLPGAALAPDDDLEPEQESPQTPALPNIAELSQSRFKRDTSEANASSIAFLAEYEGKRVLFGADAHADTLIAALQRLGREWDEEPVRIDLFKLSHHGSRGTTSLELLQQVDCHNYLISSNGARYRHPDAETIARVLTAAGDSPTLIFNYRSPSNEMWDNPSLKAQHDYATQYPSHGQAGIEIDL